MTLSGSNVSRNGRNDVGKYTLVLLDRPAWFLPTIEQEEMARIDGEALIGWARLGEPRVLDPANASLGLPA